MTKSYSQNLLAWLRDAHAMEEQAEKLFSGQAKRFREFPELNKRELCGFLVMQADASRENQRALSIRIQQLGSDVSIIKNIAGKLIAASQNLVGAMMSDEPVKAILTLHTFTQMGIGAYTILIAAAEAALDAETASLCKSILNQYQARVIWLDNFIREITECFLAKSAA